MKNNTRMYHVLFRRVIITLVCFILAPMGITQARQAMPLPSSGLLDISSHDLYRDGNIRLDGQWQFFKEQIVTPELFLKKIVPESTGYYQIPKYWTSYKDLELPAEACVSYRLLIRVNKKNRPLSLLIPEIFTEYRVFVNGVLMDSHGRFADGEIRFLSPRIITFQNARDPLEIILNIANKNHGNAGVGQSFFLGSPDNIQKQYLLSIVIEMILVAVCIFAAMYHIILFLLRRQEKELLYFGIFCILIALRTLLTGTSFIMQIIPDLSFEVGSRAATAVIPLCVMAFQTYARYFFKPYFFVKYHRVLLMFHGVYLILTLTVHPMTYSTLFSPYFLVIFASCLLIIGANIYSMIKGFRNAVIFFAGFSFVFIGVANDMLHYMQIINTGYYLSLWFSFFIIAQSVVLAIKFANEHKMVEALSKKLQVNDKLKDEFLANTSHELRTPINGIIGISDALISGIAGNLSEKVNFNLKLISSSAKRLASLINDILDYSRLKNNDIPLMLKDIDLRQITEVVLTVVKATIPSKKLSLVNDISNDFPVVRGDENRLQQILFNLIGNAVKFTDEGQVRVFANDMDTHVVVHVEDTGPGIPEHLLGTIFKSFEQVDGTRTREYGGTGLGLSITKKLLELLGGTISVQSVEQQGTVFSFTLKKGGDADIIDNEQPVTRMDKLASEKEVPGNELPVFELPINGDEMTGEKILIVDDDTTNIQVLQNYLSLENYWFKSATNGIQALEILETEVFDLVLLDIMMPRMSGYEVLKRIREKHTIYELPVLMLTAGKRNRDIITAFQSGANDYLTKPIDRQALMVRIRTQLSLGHAVANAIKNASLANTDELTGLYNRRFMISAGNRALKKAQMLNRPLSVVMLDIDLFKEVNDHYGHAEGDRVLQHLAEIITSNIREIDVGARYGGEEFVIVLPGTTSEGAGKVAEKIRHLVEQSQVKSSYNNKIIQYTVSLGTASLHDPKCSFEDLLNEADKMLYQSKEGGRNKVTVSPHPVSCSEIH